MRYDPNIHHRRSIRLSGYDYSHAGNYFVTICVEGRECLFGEVVDGHMVLNDAGRMVEQTWRDLSGKFPTAQLDAMVVMPNHMHFVIVLLAPDVVSDVGADHRARPGEAGHAHGGVGSGLRVRPDSTNTDGG
jgi:putative transposase